MRGPSVSRLDSGTQKAAVFVPRLWRGVIDKAMAVDPANRLLWRMNRQRLDVEGWRDALLAVSGELDAQVGGPPAKTTLTTRQTSPAPAQPNPPVTALHCVAADHTICANASVSIAR